MRNPIFAIFMAVLCLFSSVWAQTLTPIQTEVTRFAFADSYVTDVLDGSDGNHYLYRYYYDRSSGQKYDRLGTVNAERGTFSETNWSYPDEFSYITCFENEEGVIVYYEYYDNKEKVFTLYSNTISSKSQLASGSHRIVWLRKTRQHSVRMRGVSRQTGDRHLHAAVAALRAIQREYGVCT